MLAPRVIAGRQFFRGQKVTAQTVFSFGCFVSTAIQTFIDYLSWSDRRKQRAADSDMTAVNRRGALLPFLWIAAPVLTAVVGTALLMYHPKPVTVEKQTIVEKAVPCSPTRTGPATTHGAQAPAISGSGNGVNYGQQPVTKKP